MGVFHSNKNGNAPASMSSITRLFEICIIMMCAIGIAFSSVLIIISSYQQMNTAYLEELSARQLHYETLLNGMISSMETNCYLILRNYDIQALLRSEKPATEIELLKERMDYTNKIALLVQARSLTDYMVAVILDDGRSFTHGKAEYSAGPYSKDNYYTNHAYYNTLRNGSSSVWLYSKYAYSVHTYHEGWLIVGVPAVNQQTNEVCGIVICEAPASDMISLFSPDTDSLTVFSSESEIFSLNPTDMDSHKQSVSYLSNGWQLSIPVPRAVNENLPILILELLAIASVIAIVGLLFSRIIHRRIATPIARLITQMEQFPLEPLTSSIDIVEISNLYQGFNRMIIHINELIDDIRKKEKEKQKSKLALLQAQIDPHFLYNSLDMIGWKIKTSTKEDAYQSLIDFAKYYRLSLSMGSSLVLISKELERMDLFLRIMNGRYLSQIQYAIEADENFAGMHYCYTMLLQPLIENAISHGILMTEEQSGKITIRVYEAAGCACFEVSDTGAGIPEDELQLLRKRLTCINHETLAAIGHNGHGYGLYNIAYRLQLLDDSRYRISIDSKPNALTTVCIYFPLIDSNNPLKNH